MKIAAEKYIYLLPTLVLGLFYLYRSIDFPVHDFANYYFGGQFFSHGQFDHNVYFPYWFNSRIYAAGHNGIFAAYAPNTPFLALVFAPLSMLPVAVAKLFFNAVSLLLFLWSLLRIASRYRVDSFWLLAIPIVFFVPIKNQVLFGQVYFLVFFLLAECWLAYEKRQLKTAALYLSIAILLKVFPLLMLLFFMFRKQFKLLGYVFLFCAILIVFTGVFCGFGVWSFYLVHVLPKAGRGEIATAFVDNYQSVFMFLKRLLVYDPLENPQALFDNPALLGIISGTFKMAIIAIGFYAARKSAPLNAMSYWIVAMVVLSPYGSTYTFLLFVFPFLAFAGSALSPVKKVLSVLLLALLANLPLAAVSGWAYPFSYMRLFVLLTVLLAMVLMVRQAVNWKMISGLSAAVLILMAVSSKNETVSSTTFSNQKLPILVYDYDGNASGIAYSFFDENGFSGASVPNPGKMHSPGVALELRNNEIYLDGKPIASDDGNKRKPVLYGQTIVYLSDYGRGLGFYTLRKVELNNRHE